MPEQVVGKPVRDVPALMQLIPFSELGVDQAATIRNAIIDNVVKLAMVQLGLPASKLVVRDIRALEDLSFPTESFAVNTGSTGNAYETYISGTMAADRWVAIYGVHTSAENQSCSAIKFNVGGGDRAIWQLEALKSAVTDDYTGFAPSAVIIPSNAPFTISRYVKQVSSACQIVLKGIVVETRGKVISP